MSKRGDPEYVSDIREAIKRIDSYVKGVSHRKFLQNKQKQDAVVRNLEIIGEAAKKISLDFKRKHKDIDWKSIAGMRDILIHQYFGVDLEIVWNVVKNKLPELKAHMEKVLAQRKINEK